MAFGVRRDGLAAICLLCGAVRLYGQDIALSLADAVGAAGGKVSAPISVRVQPQAKVAALQWSLSYPPDDIGSVTVVAADAAAADKTVVCGSKPGNTTCLLYGMNQNVILDGVLVEVTFELSERPHSLIVIELTHVIAASPDGAPVSVSGEAAAKIVVAPHPPRRR